MIFINLIKTALQTILKAISGSNIQQQSPEYVRSKNSSNHKITEILRKANSSKNPF